MIITGGTLLIFALWFGVAGGLRASVRQLIGAALFAIAGLAFVIGGTVMAMRAKRAVPGQPLFGARSGAAAAAVPIYVVYVPVVPAEQQPRQ